MVLSSSQAAFANRLLQVIKEAAVPGLDPLAVYATGVTQIREVFPSEALPFILRGYMAGIKAAFATLIGVSGLSLLVLPFGDWRRLGQKPVADAEDTS